MFDAFSLFVTSSQDLWCLPSCTDEVAKFLRGKKRTSFWMLWPAEWEDFDDPDYACYVERHALFSSMRALEAAGVPTGFPHPADQYELITSKSWMATLSLHPRVCLPAATLVHKSDLKRDPLRAAKAALSAMNLIRRANPYPAEPGEPSVLAQANKSAITKGVVKLGWSWENRYVLRFTGLQQLQERLVELLTAEHCTANACIVQEWVDFDFEMRLYFFPARHLEEHVDLFAIPFAPVRIECNEWTAGDSRGQHRSFHKLSKQQILDRWAQDEEAWEETVRKATDIAQVLIAWLISANAAPVPMIRLDFMIRKMGPGKVRVVFGEYCEMGACCLGWKEGPPTIWREALDCALR